MFSDLYYIGGLFDGEGCAGIYRPCRLNASIQMGKKEGLNIVVAIFGGRLAIQKGKYEYNTPMFGLSYSSTNAEKFLKAILPFLHVKKGHVELVLDTWEKLKHTPRCDWLNVIQEYDNKRVKTPNQGGGKRGQDKKSRRTDGYFVRYQGNRKIILTPPLFE